MTSPEQLVQIYNNSIELFHQNCTNCSAPLNKSATRAPDNNYLYKTSPPELLVQIQNSFSELFLIIPSTKITQMGLLR